MGVWDDYRQVCEKDADCPREDLGQVCLYYYWDIVKDGSSYATGHACYNWEAPVCPADDFSSYNYNYDGSKWSYFAQMRCNDDYSESGASVLLSSSALFLAALA